MHSTLNLDCDALILRYAGAVTREAKRLGVEVVHITGPGDMGRLGCSVARRLGVPVAMGWHTSLHEYAGKRLGRLLSFAPNKFAEGVAQFGEKQALAFLGRFYSRAQAIFTPNHELLESVHDLSGRPTYLIGRGVDTHLFTPARRNRSGSRFRIGYVGRLTPEKNVQFLAELGRGLERTGKRSFEFQIVGQGSERDWLKANVPNAVLPGVLLGEELAQAYANMDLFVFPSTTDTFGNVVLEALASGVPCVVTASGGPKFLVQPAVTGYVAPDEASFLRYVSSLMTNLDAHHAMKAAARHYAFGWSWDRVFEMVFKIYDAGLLPRKLSSKAPARDRMCLSA